MATWLCKTCCAEFPEAPDPPAHCPICTDPRQYVRAGGQEWLRSDTLPETHRTGIRRIAPGLTGIGVTPALGIGQRALLIEHEQGGVLWDGVPLIDDAALEEIKSLGGVRAMVMSHPHLYGAMVTNAKKLGNVPIYLPAADRQWTMNPSGLIEYFEAETLDLGHGVTLHVTGGHFDGSSILHWADGADKKGALLTGDTIMVVADRDWASFMWSTPNLVNLNPRAIRRIVDVATALPFETIYGGWWDAVMQKDAPRKLRASRDRILAQMAIT